jgi:hypothetical protein
MERYPVRRSALLGTVIALVLGLGGCSSETPGDARPGDDTGSGGAPPFPAESESSTTDEPTETDTEGGDTADLRPCELLSAEDLTALDLPASGEEDEIGPARRCQWQTSGSHTVSVGILDELGIDQVQSQGPTEELSVGSHEALRYVGVVGTCGVAIAVSDSSRVDVLGTAGGDMNQACEIANQVAELVEPKLP